MKLKITKKTFYFLFEPDYFYPSLIIFTPTDFNKTKRLTLVHEDRILSASKEQWLQTSVIEWRKKGNQSFCRKWHEHNRVDN